METGLLFELPIAGKETKILINRHCTKQRVLYSVEMLEGDQTTECLFMAYDRDEWSYKFTTAPTSIELMEKENEFSEFIFEYFHNYNLN